jgi:hypothetical protein
MSTTNLQKSYIEYYKPLLRKFCKELTDKLPASAYHGIPRPFIPAWGKRYEQSMVKMAFIGLETCGFDPTLPKYIEQVQREEWDSSFDISKFQNIDYVGWTAGKGTRYTFWGFVMYFLAALYNVKNWEVLKQRKHQNLLNCFVWGNASAIECWKSDGIPEGTDPKAHQIAREAAYPLNDFQHMQTIFTPNVSIIMCCRESCDQFLRNTDKKLLWDQEGVRLWKSDNAIIFNMPHPNNMRYNKRADHYANIIRTGLKEHGWFQPMKEFMDYDKETTELLNTFFTKCRERAQNTKEAVAFIATELRKQNARMTVRLLCNLLNELGYRTTYGTEYSAGRGSYRMIASAWKHYNDNLKKPDIAENIALAFTKPNGEYAYDV